MPNRNDTYSAITFNPTPVNFQPISGSGQKGNYSGVVGSALGFVNGILDRRQERKLAEEQRNWNEEMMDKQNEWSLDMWNRTNEYNSPLEQIKRLRDAGLNPLYYGLDGSSANGLESAQPLGYDRASMKGLANPIQGALDGYAQMTSLQKDVELKNAQIDKIKSDTKGVDLDNEWKDKTMEARVQSEELKNSVTREQIENFKKEREKMDKEITKLIEEANTEIEKRAYIQAQKMLAVGQFVELVALLPYKAMLMDAETEAQKASAAASYAQAAKENHLIEGGYYDSLIEQAKEDARKAGYMADDAEVQKELDEYKLALKNGTVFKRQRKLEGKKYDTFAYVVDKVYQSLVITSDAVGGPLMAILGGSMVGKAARGSKSGKSEPSYMFPSDISSGRGTLDPNNPFSGLHQ